MKPCTMKFSDSVFTEPVHIVFLKLWGKLLGGIPNSSSEQGLILF